MTFLLSSSIDIFEARTNAKSIDQDCGLLQAIDERLAMYGWQTNTGTKFVIIVDMEGRPPAATESSIATINGLKDSDLKPVSIFMMCSSQSNKTNETPLKHLIGISSHTISIH